MEGFKFNVCLHVALLFVLTLSAIKAWLSVVFEVSIERPVAFISPSAEIYDCTRNSSGFFFNTGWDCFKSFAVVDQ